MYMKRKYESLEEIADAVRVCTKCPLCKTRKMSVPGNGSTSAKIMFIGEAPGRSEIYAVDHLQDMQKNLDATEDSECGAEL